MKNNDLLKTHEVVHITPERHFQCLKKEHKYNRNDLCPCGSGRKIKHCCVNLLDTQYISTHPAPVMSEEERKCKVDGIHYKR